MKLKSLKSTLRPAPQRMAQAPTLSENRMSGRKLQARRLRKWTEAEGCCAACGKLTDWPHGFELDHKVRLDQGGPDTDENTQILCVEFDAAGMKRGCHEAKTKDELSRGRN